MTKTCNFLYNLTESSTFKLEGVPNLTDLYLTKIQPNSSKLHSDKNQICPKWGPIPQSSIVIKIKFAQNEAQFLKAP